MRRSRKVTANYGAWCDGCEAWIRSGLLLTGPAESATEPPLTQRKVFLCTPCVRHIVKASERRSSSG